MNQFVKEHPFKAVLALIPFTLAAHLFLGWLVGDAMPLVNPWHVIQAWQAMLAHGDWQAIQFMVGQKLMAGQALALAAEGALLFQIIWAGAIVLIWRWVIK